MKIRCPECSYQVDLDESRVPAGPSFKVKCSKCTKVFVANKDLSPAPPAEVAPPEPPKQIHTSADWERLKPAVEAMIKSKLEIFKEEMLAALAPAQQDVALAAEAYASNASATLPGKRALVCEEDRETADQIIAALRRLGYSVDHCVNAIEALKKMDSRYNLITTNTGFTDDPQGGQKILTRINSEKQDFRRLVFVVLISASVKTVDASNGFFQGVNIVVNKEDIKNLDRLVLEGQRDFEALYSTFNELLESTNDRL